MGSEISYNNVTLIREKFNIREWAFSLIKIFLIMCWVSCMYGHRIKYEKLLAAVWQLILKKMSNNVLNSSTFPFDLYICSMEIKWAIWTLFVFLVNISRKNSLVTRSTIRVFYEAWPHKNPLLGHMSLNWKVLKQMSDFL